ncbi:MAG: isoleucine--tRNA ligase [Thermoprotei archaeon]|nr:MAG: isoleucine--tRNA ligase [Thermoprotei archaeon]
MGTVGLIPKVFEPKKFEEEVLKFWDENRIYEKLRERLRGRPKFYFLDGPPYPSSDVPHIGTCWNKILKDVVVRYRRMRGYYVHDVPGYDCHGLPIEVAVEKKLGFKSKKDIEELGVDKFIEECRKLALANAASMTKYFKDLGVSLNWDRPYLTLTNEYIEAAWWFIKKAHERGLLKRGLKVLHWCPRCETVLADYEVTEYRELEDPSIYVKFPVKGREREYIVIWTTTPWTLPANVAVMVHPDHTYVRVKVKKTGEVLILAKPRLEHVIKECNLGEVEVLEEFPGEALQGLEYEHPLADEVPIQRQIRHVVVTSREFVTMEEGTGCVHTAPGHGEEDFEVAKRYGLPVLCPVDSRGRFTSEAGKYANLYVREANSVIISDLERKGYLLHVGKIVHRYPVCWRCKTPLIYRATEQWFIEITKLKDRFLEEAAKVNWIPAWAGSARFRNWLMNLRDWVISRQRYWGIPLPIWVCTKCGHYVVIGSREELLERAIEKVELPDLHKPWIDRVVLRCEKCGGEMRRVPDVADVWLDSGIAFFASLGYPRNSELFNKLYPVDFITEGHDQIAGWFFSLLRASVIAFDQAPYRTVLMHGFTLDEQGREMHKSLGNYVAPNEVIEKYCREALRLFVLSNTVWEDLRFSWKKVEEAYSDLNILWNVYYFASTYMNLDKFDPEKYRLEDYLHVLEPEDRWIISRVNSVNKVVVNALESYHIHEAVRALRRFTVEDLSHWYIMLIRRRVWIEEERLEKLTAYITLFYVLEKLLRLLAPFLPMITEAIYQRMFRPALKEAPESIHYLEYPLPDEKLIDERCERLMDVVKEIVEKVSALRMKAGVKRRWPLRELVIATDSQEVREAIDMYRKILLTQCNVKKVEVVPSSEVRKFIRYVIEPVFSKIGPVYRGLTKKIVEYLSKQRPEDIAAALLEKGCIEFEIEGQVVRLSRDMINIREEPQTDYLITETRNFKVILSTTLTKEEIAEGLARDVVRRIQYMRKVLDLPLDATIEVVVYGPESEIELIKQYTHFIASETRARKVKFVGSRDEVTGDLVTEWEIDGSKYVIGVKRIQ